MKGHIHTENDIKNTTVETLNLHLYFDLHSVSTKGLAKQYIYAVTAGFLEKVTG